MSLVRNGGSCNLSPQVIWQGMTVNSTETKRLGVHLGQFAQRGDFFAFCGPLGVGKTTLIQGFAEGFEVDSDAYVRSPTFAIVHEYQGKYPLYHFDFYRLSHWTEALDIGFIDYLDESGVVVVEWAERFPQLWPVNYVEIAMQILPSGSRSICLKAYETTYARWLQHIPSEVQAQ